MKKSSHFTAAALLLALLLNASAPQAAESAQAIVKIAVFDFELEDSSAGGGIVGQDSYDTLYLAEATDMARRLLAESGRYSPVDTKDAQPRAGQSGGLRNCGGCEAAIARELGAGQAMIGVVNRISRTEFTVRIRVVDARSGETVSSGFTDLRVGGNGSWPRGVKWLIGKLVQHVQANK